MTQALTSLMWRMRAEADKWDRASYRSGHYDDFGAGEEHRAQVCAEIVAAWADEIGSVLRALGEQVKETP